MGTRKPKPSLKDHRKQGQLPIPANAVYVGESRINIYLTYDRAVQAATNLLKKAELNKGDDDHVINVWTEKGSDCGQLWHQRRCPIRIAGLLEVVAGTGQQTTRTTCKPGLESGIGNTPTSGSGSDLRASCDSVSAASLDDARPSDRYTSLFDELTICECTDASVPDARGYLHCES